MSDLVLIIGGTSGIGLEAAKYLGHKNYNVITCGRKKVEIKGVTYYELDVKSDQSIKALYDKVKNEYNELNGIVFSVGITTKIKSVSEFDENVWNDILDTNVTGFLRILKYFYSSLKESGGRVVVISSIAARTYSKYSGYEYTASKSALGGIVRQLAIEWADDKILINSVFPSMTLTPMLKKNLDQKKLKKIEENLPLKKLASPVDIARAIEFLISRNNNYITGVGIDVSGGLFLNG